MLNFNDAINQVLVLQSTNKRNEKNYDQSLQDFYDCYLFPKRLKTTRSNSRGSVHMQRILHWKLGR